MAGEAFGQSEELEEGDDDEEDEDDEPLSEDDDEDEPLSEDDDSFDVVPEELAEDSFASLRRLVAFAPWSFL